MTGRWRLTNTGCGVRRLPAAHAVCLTRRDFKCCARALPGGGAPERTTISYGPSGVSNGEERERCGQRVRLYDRVSGASVDMTAGWSCTHDRGRMALLCS